MQPGQAEINKRGRHEQDYETGRAAPLTVLSLLRISPPSPFLAQFHYKRLSKGFRLSETQYTLGTPRFTQGHLIYAGGGWTIVNTSASSVGIAHKQ